MHPGACSHPKLHVCGGGGIGTEKTACCVFFWALDSRYYATRPLAASGPAETLSIRLTASCGWIIFDSTFPCPSLILMK